MPKMKTKSSVKRFSITATGKVRATRASGTDDQAHEQADPAATRHHDP